MLLALHSLMLSTAQFYVEHYNCVWLGANIKSISTPSVLEVNHRQMHIACFLNFFHEIDPQEFSPFSFLCDPVARHQIPAVFLLL